MTRRRSGDPEQDLPDTPTAMSRAKKNGTRASVLAPSRHLCRELGTGIMPAMTVQTPINLGDQAEGHKHVRLGESQVTT